MCSCVANELPGRHEHDQLRAPTQHGERGGDPTLLFRRHPRYKLYGFRCIVEGLGTEFAVLGDPTLPFRRRPRYGVEGLGPPPAQL